MWTPLGFRMDHGRKPCILLSLLSSSARVGQDPCSFMLPDTCAAAQGTCLRSKDVQAKLTRTMLLPCALRIAGKPTARSRVVRPRRQRATAFSSLPALLFRAARQARCKGRSPEQSCQTALPAALGCRCWEHQPCEQCRKVEDAGLSLTISPADAAAAGQDLYPVCGGTCGSSFSSCLGAAQARYINNTSWRCTF